MKFYVNGKFAVMRLTGVQRVAVELIREIRELGFQDGTVVELVVLSPPQWLQGSRWRPALAFLWEQCVLPIRARDGVLLSLCNTGPILKKRQVVILHDAAVFDMPQNYGKRYGLVHRTLMRALAARVERVFTVSRFSQRRLADNLKLNPADIEVLGAAGHHICRIPEDPAVLKKLALQDGKYLVAIGSRQPGKNFLKLIEVVHRAQIPLVIVGGVDSAIFRTDGGTVQGQITETGYVSDAELVSLIKHARGYIQPSLYEGFGLPVLEAMSLGTPVLCSNAGALPEVCGEAALYFDPADSATMLAAIRRLFSDDDLVEKLRAVGMRQAASYRWTEPANRLISALQCFRVRDVPHDSLS